jgi:hypothetical protein
MLIYGNTPGDIGKMFMKNKYKTLGVMIAGAIVVGLVFTKLHAEDTIKLTSMNKFFDALGSGEFEIKTSSMDSDNINPGINKCESTNNDPYSDNWEN